MIVLTGITGLVGSHIAADLLSRGESVRAIVRSDSNLQFVRKIFTLYHANGGELYNQIEFVNGDILRYDTLLDAFDHADTVIHTAAIVSFNPSERKEVIQNNVEGTANVVNACLECGVKQLGYISSIAAIGDAEEGELTTELTPWENSGHNSGYSISKHHAELEVWRGIEEGLKAVIVNPSVVIGPGHWTKGSSSLIAAIYKGMRFYTKGGTGYVDVRDVSKCLLALLDKKVSGQRYILNSENLSFFEMFSLTARALGVNEPSAEAKPWMVKVAVVLDWFASLLGKNRQMTRETARSAFHTTLYSNQKIKDELDYVFIPMSKSVTDTAAQFLREVER